MVKLTSSFEQAGRTAADGGSARTTPRSHHNWRASRNRRRGEAVTEPGLLELEEMTRTTVKLMEKHSPKSEHNYHLAMDLLRLQYNMNFMVLCERCNGLHANDEILAPER